MPDTSFNGLSTLTARRVLKSKLLPLEPRAPSLAFNVINLEEENIKEFKMMWGESRLRPGLPVGGSGVLG